MREQPGGKLFEQVREFDPKFAVVRDAALADKLALRCRNAGLTTAVLHGVEALSEMASHPEVDTVMAAIVGAAGLEADTGRGAAGKKILLANKEVLVMAGELFMRAVREHRAICCRLTVNIMQFFNRFHPISHVESQPVVCAGYC